MSLLDPGQIIKAAFDDATNSFNVKSNIAVNVDGSHDIVIDDAHDSIKIGNGSGTYLKVNSDGSLNVVTSTSIQNFTLINNYSEANSVPANSETTIITFTATKNTYIQQIQTTGDNVSQFKVYKNGTLVDKQFSSFFNFNCSFDYRSNIGSLPGFPLVSSDIITVSVTHTRPTTGNFSSRLQLLTT